VDVPPGRLRFKDLCIDAVDAARAATFWSGVLGLTPESRGNNFRLSDDVAEHTLWVNAVPEPRTVKQRVHLDVHTGAVADLIRLGATVGGEEQHWTVLRDPEGGELCAFVRPADQLPGYRLYELGVDAADAERIASWWAERFGVTVEHSEGGDFCWLEGVPGMPWAMVFQPVPEPKQVKNRVHWDLWGRTEDALDAGARLVRARDDEISWDVLADPEGNEFCVFDVQ
jgi:catechol 2,3-dioxygenase-like lactoylglutathione lyase family enzyme